MNKHYINLNGDDSVTKYFKEVRKSTVITAEQEVELSKRIQEGDDSAIEELVFANLKFVISIAKEYQNQGLPLSDLINEGNYGLIKAATKFDHTRGFRFISYAVWWVKQSIIQSLNDNARTIRLPTNVINKLSQLRKEVDKFKLENEREPVYGDIEIEGETVEVFNFEQNVTKSLNDVINEDGSELYEIIENPNTVEVENFYDVDSIVKDELNKTLALLSDRERLIIEYYYGLDSNYEPMTLEAIGEKFNLTKERVRQIKHNALRKLRHNAYELFNVLNK
jgi:RNA polymerase primary sigma factor